MREGQGNEKSMDSILNRLGGVRHLKQDMSKGKDGQG
jgi:hypothetical protein